MIVTYHSQQQLWQLMITLVNNETSFIILGNKLILQMIVKHVINPLTS